MDTKIEIGDFSFDEIFDILAPIFKQGRNLPSANQEIFIIGDDYLQGRRGKVIDEEVGGALITVATHLAKHIINKSDYTSAEEMKTIKVIERFCDHLKSMGIEIQ